jgi:NAD(P)H-hydrate epimerase
MSGAAVLCGQAALRSGAGLATIACPRAIQDVVAAGFHCYTTSGLNGDENGRLATADLPALIALATNTDVLAVGPGLGNGDGVALCIRGLLKLEKSVVIDADGLNAISPLEDETLASRRAATVVTPHPGEFARLTGEAAPVAHEQRLAAAMSFAQRHRTVLLLKGHCTIIADGQSYSINATGNPGMATGGTGDVLTGIIAALIGQKLDAFDAAVLGAHVHGLAGDLAAAELGQVSMTAADLLAHLPQAFLCLERKS